MRVDAMRYLDRLVGTPACFVLSLLIRLRSAFGGKASTTVTPRRILFIGLAELGALVVAHPALELARQRFPQAELYFLTFTPGMPMLRLMGFAEERIIALEPSSPLRLVRDTVAALRRIRRLKIDTTVAFEIYVRFAALLAGLSGAQQRVGFFRFHEEGHYLGDLATHRLIYSPHHHIAHAYMALVQTVGEPASRQPQAKLPVERLPLHRLRIPVSAPELASVRRKLAARIPDLWDHDRLVILNANAGDLVAQRRWPLENYVALAQRLLDGPGVRIVLTGTATERPGVEDLARRIGNSSIVNLAGETTLAELIALFHMAALLVTNDSGPAHFASTTDLPTIVLFGPETPRIFGPLGPAQEAIYLDYACSPCVSVYNQKRSPCGDNRCLKDISVETVLAAAHRHLAAARPGVSP